MDGWVDGCGTNDEVCVCFSRSASFVARAAYSHDCAITAAKGRGRGEADGWNVRRRDGNVGGAVGVEEASGKH